LPEEVGYLPVGGVRRAEAQVHVQRGGEQRRLLRTPDQQSPDLPRRAGPRVGAVIAQIAALRSRKRRRVRTISVLPEPLGPASATGRPGPDLGPGRRARGPDGSGRPLPPRAERRWRSGALRALDGAGAGSSAGSPGTGRGREPRLPRRVREARLKGRRPTASDKPWNTAATPRARKTGTPIPAGQPAQDELGQAAVQPGPQAGLEAESEVVAGHPLDVEGDAGQERDSCPAPMAIEGSRIGGRAAADSSRHAPAVSKPSAASWAARPALGDQHPAPVPAVQAEPRAPGSRARAPGHPGGHQERRPLPGAEPDVKGVVG
jgi:hypothetical protein